jgi:hypothetical protein
MALGLTQSLTEMSSRNISWGVKQPGCGVDHPPPPALSLYTGTANLYLPFCDFHCMLQGDELQVHNSIMRAVSDVIPNLNNPIFR